MADIVKVCKFPTDVWHNRSHCHTDPNHNPNPTMLYSDLKFKN